VDTPSTKDEEMTIIEAGIISGISTGALIGGIILKSHGSLSIAGGALAGMVSGGLAGWLYAVVIIVFLSVIGGIWRGVRKRPEPSEADMQAMSNRAVRGIFIGAFFSFVIWSFSGWLPALLAAFAFALVYTFGAVAQIMLR
jgi:hypothetical protein